MLSFKKFLIKFSSSSNCKWSLFYLVGDGRTALDFFMGEMVSNLKSNFRYEAFHCRSCLFTLLMIEGIKDSCLSPISSSSGVSFLFFSIIGFSPHMTSTSSSLSSRSSSSSFSLFAISSYLSNEFRRFSAMTSLFLTSSSSVLIYAYVAYHIFRSGDASFGLISHCSCDIGRIAPSTSK